MYMQIKSQTIDALKYEKQNIELSLAVTEIGSLQKAYRYIITGSSLLN